MKKTKDLLLLALRPGAVWKVLLALISVAALTAVFATGREKTAFGYVAYLVSAYTLTVITIGIPARVVKMKTFAYKNKYSGRYLTDIPFRTKLTLYTALTINTMYAAVNMISGIVYSSFWFGALALYYVILGAVRFLLLRHVREDETERDMVREYKKYRLCGVLLFAVNIALTGVVYQMINHGEGSEYPGLLIYVAAVYTFYYLSFAVINIIRYRKYNSPVLIASRAVNLAAALVSILSLQNAMFAAFGESGTLLPQIMNNITGCCVCLSIFAIAVIMVVRANHALSQMEVEK